ncbi:sporulene cyclase [Alicyclobacillus sacchari]|uniref:Sporulene cyclase n=1 Tax=Alicyclobacillus sacchari TaxID=392010 RepID=A0A4R8LJN4_9BACL|nr:prenyltransferase/squalene oxidase repeat-containing protein [Alicyclobacillus sacchari]TDY44002.1 sporulene cyclase [Alicyclobacillus sacchari]
MKVTYPEIGCEDIDAVVQAACVELLQHQGEDGAWGDCFDTGMMPNAQTVISLHLIGHRDRAWIEPLVYAIRQHQREDGSWGLFPGGAGDVSTTVECFYALELMEAWAAEDAPRTRAKAWIARHDGVRRCRNLTKMFLAIGGEIPWSWLPSPWLYTLMFMKGSPFSIQDIATFTRVHIPAMLVLSLYRYRSPYATGALRELVRYEEHERDDPLTNSFRSNLAAWCAKRCLTFLRMNMGQDGTLAGYHSSTWLSLFALHALGVDLEAPIVQSAIASMRQNLIVNNGTGYAHQQTANAYVWNSALASRVLLEAAIPPTYPPLQRAKAYLLSKQQMEPRTRGPIGGWGFSSNNVKHPDCDDTVACLDAFMAFPDVPKSSVDVGVSFLFSMQNRDGGWSAFEHNCDKRWLERLPANDMHRSMCDPSTADITGRVVAFLLRRSIVSPTHPSVQRAISWLQANQCHDGSWYGRWGTTYLYGTWCAVQALVTANFSLSNTTLKRALRWLLSVQRLDGSFGERCESDVLGRYSPASAGQPTQTAWGLDALLYLYDCSTDSTMRSAIQRAATKAAAWLLDNKSADGWHDTLPNGSAFPGALYVTYHIYPRVWPVMALLHFRRSIVGHKERPEGG